MNQIYYQKIIDYFIHSYFFPKLIEAIRSIELNLIDKLSSLIAATAVKSGRFFAFGNGGSEAIAGILAHLLDRFLPDCYKFDTYYPPSLNEITDSENAKLFNSRIIRSGRPGDLVFLISASGDSLNINEVSALCHKLGLVTISISGNGAIVKNRNAANHNIVFHIKDQQILEDATLAIINLLVIFAVNKLNGKTFDPRGVRELYLDRYSEALKVLKVNSIQRLVDDLIEAYQNNHIIRVDAPDSGLLSFCAKHMEHNLKWDALSNIRNRPINKVFSGLSSCHITGVGNDGGEYYNYALEIEDNLRKNDVEIIFAKSLNALSVKSLLKAANNSGCKLHIFHFDEVDEGIAANLAQSILHITARILNSYLLLYQNTIDESGFGYQLGMDLALLRQKGVTSVGLEEKFGL